MSTATTRRVTDAGLPYGVFSGSRLLELSRSFTARFLAPRTKFLNGRPSRDKYVNNLRRDLACGSTNKPKPVHMLLALTLADACEPDMPIEAVAGTFDALALLVRAIGAECRHGDLSDAPSLAEIIAAEDHAEYTENCAEHRVIADENDPVALRQLLDANLAESEHMARVRQAIEAKLHALEAK